MDHKGFFGQIARRWLLALVGVIVVAGVSWINIYPVDYTAEADVFISVQGDDSVELSSGSTFSQQQARNLSQLASRDLVLRPVIDRLSLDESTAELSKRVTTSVPVDTSIIVVSAKFDTAERAILVANAAADSLAEAALKLLPQPIPGGVVINIDVLHDGAEPAAANGAGKKVVFIGDSYTQGTGASSERFRWTTLVSEAEGWQEVNLGLGGTGYLAESGLKGCGETVCENYQGVVSDAVGSSPDVVVVAGGQNDFLAYEKTPGAVDKAISQTFSELRRQLPEAEIIAVGPSTTGKVGGPVVAVDKEVRQAASRVGAKYISLLKPQPVIKASMILPDKAHVDDSGHKAIAGRVIAEIG